MNGTGKRIKSADFEQVNLPQRVFARLQILSLIMTLVCLRSIPGTAPFINPVNIHSHKKYFQ
jgi:hypothetical protein